MSALQFALILNFCESVHDMISQSVQTLACFLSVDARILARDVFVTELYRIGGVSLIEHLPLAERARQEMVDRTAPALHFVPAVDDDVLRYDKV